MVYNDIHGVKQLLTSLNSSQSNVNGIGPEYQSNDSLHKWNNGVTRDIYPDELGVSNFLQTQNLDKNTSGIVQDPWIDFNAHGWDCPGHNGQVGDQNKGKINGTGDMTLQGKQPRCYIYDTANPTTRQWRNFEFTAFSRLFALKTPVAGETAVPTMSLRGRTHHHRYDWCRCNGSGYIAQVIPGSTRPFEFRKEYAHASYNDSPKANFTFTTGLWYGFKFIVQGFANNSNVSLKFYTTPGHATGDKQNWTLHSSMVDDGTNMPINHDDPLGISGVIATCTSNCIDSSPAWQQSPYTATVNMRGCAVYLRASWVDDIKFKWVNVHEVASLP